MLTKRWIICKNHHDELTPIEITVDETAKQVCVYEKHNHPGTAKWRVIAECLHYRTRLSKGDHRLFGSKQEAIDKTIERLHQSRLNHLKKAEEIIEQIRKLEEIAAS